jgi:hypothetical protein
MRNMKKMLKNAEKCMLCEKEVMCRYRWERRCDNWCMAHTRKEREREREREEENV